MVTVVGQRFIWVATGFEPWLVPVAPPSMAAFAVLRKWILIPKNLFMHSNPLALP
jgi:hypothetical protein